LIQIIFILLFSSNLSETKTKANESSPISIFEPQVQEETPQLDKAQIPTDMKPPESVPHSRHNLQNMRKKAEVQPVNSPKQENSPTTKSLLPVGVWQSLAGQKERGTSSTLELNPQKEGSRPSQVPVLTKPAMEAEKDDPMLIDKPGLPPQQVTTDQVEHSKTVAQIQNSLVTKLTNEN